MSVDFLLDAFALALETGARPTQGITVVHEETVVARLVDHVEFVPRLRWLTTGLVTRDVQRIFRYRQEMLTKIFSGSPSDR
jgi:hypothetical protein